MPIVPPGDILKSIATGSPYTPVTSFNPDKKELYNTQGTTLGALSGGPITSDGVDVTVPSGFTFIQNGIIVKLTANFVVNIPAIAFPKSVVANNPNEVPGTPVTIEIVNPPVPGTHVVLGTLNPNNATVVPALEMSIRALHERIEGVAAVTPVIDAEQDDVLIKANIDVFNVKGPNLQFSSGPANQIDLTGVLDIKDEGATQTVRTSSIDFVGDGVEVTAPGANAAQVSIPAIQSKEEGVTVVPRTRAINFTGTGVTATQDGGNPDQVNVAVSAAVLTGSAPTQVDAGDAAAVGVATDAARADHQHAVNTALVGDIAAVDAGAAAAGVANTLPRADHKHSVSVAAPVATGTANAAGAAATLSRSDHVHRTQVAVEDEGIAAGSRPTINFIGPGISAVDNPGNDRVDVTLSAAVPSNLTPTSIDPDDAGAAGVSAEVSRADHQHAIVADTAGTIAVGDTASEGVATSFSRSDHRHALPAPAAPADVTKAAASAGVATTVARADHKHDVSTAVAVDITDASNAEGILTSLSRSDHIHAHGSRGGGTLHAVATPSVAGFMSAADKTNLDSLFTLSTVTTSDATETTLATIAIPNDTSVLIEAHIVANDSSERAGYVLRALVYRIGAGAAAIEGQPQDPFVRESTATMDATIDVDGGNNARIRVTGIAATVVNWKSRHSTIQVS